MLHSPGIQIFESSTTPAAEVVANTNGVATLGYSTRGPLNKLVRLASVSEFASIFGKPVSASDEAYSHILVNNVLSQQNAPVYFMRIGASDAKEATCPVTNATLTPARVAIKENGIIPNYFTISKGEGTLVDGSVFEITIASDAEEASGSAISSTVSVPLTSIYTDSTLTSLQVSIYTVLSALSEDSTISSLYDFRAYTPGLKETEAGEDPVLASDAGILITRKKENTSTTTTVTLAFKKKDGTAYAATDIDDEPTVLDGTGDVKKFAGLNLGKTSVDSSLVLEDHFLLSAKDPGSGMNGVAVVKSTNGSLWEVRLLDEDGVELEVITSIQPSKFIETINDKSRFIAIDADLYVKGTNPTKSAWENGTYVLGKGQLLSSGAYWIHREITKDGTFAAYYPVEGTDGYSEDKGITTSYYVAALGSTDFTNCDENSFSILATPGTQEYLVQQAAVALCETRGDAIYLVDVPRQYCESKSEIQDAVSWSNENPAFQSSYAAIYYGTFAQTNPYDTTANIWLPASVFIAPKMIRLDETVGEFYAPAGIQNGTISVADYGYSPDQEDRDVLVGDNNVINPIIYSNTRGVFAFAQKTTDRSASALNRVGVRRMTNAIKRNLRSSLQELLFRINNEYSRSRARRLVDNVMLPLQSAGAVDNYTINVVSGTGAARNELYVYLTFVPNGLIEKIYVYINITDAGVQVTEAVA